MRQRPSFFVPAPPLTASPGTSSKTPRHKHVRRRAATLSATQAVGLPPVTPKESTGNVGDGTPCGFVSTQSTVSTADLPELQPVSPQEPSLADTPAGSSSMANTPAGNDVAVLHKNPTAAGQALLVTSSISSASAESFTTAPSIIRWRKGEKIGAGSHGCVFKAQNKANGKLFVVKENIVQDLEYHERLERELDICKDLDHPNIVKCLGHEYCERHLYIHLEYVSGGSLRCMLTEFGPLDEELMPLAMRGLLEGLEYLHTRSPPVVHRDIKSPNILVGQDFCMKLADFGCSKRDDTTTSFTTTGSVLWMAPEVIRGQKGGHGRKADIWSLGCVFIEMATGEKPWGKDAFDNVLQAMRHIEGSERTPPIPDTQPENIRDLIMKCVQREPSQRARSSELLEHELLRGVARQTD